MTAYKHTWFLDEPLTEADAIKQAEKVLRDVIPAGLALHRRTWTLDDPWLTVTGQLHPRNHGKSNCPACLRIINPPVRRYPPDPLVKYVTDDRLDKSERETLAKVIRRGQVREDIADRWACRLGLHPCLLWPEWFEEAAA